MWTKTPYTSSYMKQNEIAGSILIKFWISQLFASALLCCIQYNDKDCIILYNSHFVLQLLKIFSIVKSYCFISENIHNVFYEKIVVFNKISIFDNFTKASKKSIKTYTLFVLERPLNIFFIKQ